MTERTADRIIKNALLLIRQIQSRGPAVAKEKNLVCLVSV
jgi:hypothetical protein